MVLTVGRLCLKIAGRDANKKCVVVDVLDKNFVLIDGETRRKRCNIIHLEPLSQVVSLKKKASHEDVKEAFRELGITITDKKPKSYSKSSLSPQGREAPVLSKSQVQSKSGNPLKSSSRKSAGKPRQKKK